MPKLSLQQTVPTFLQLIHVNAIVVDKVDHGIYTFHYCDHQTSSESVRILFPTCHLYCGHVTRLNVSCQRFIASIQLAMLTYDSFLQESCISPL